MRRPTLPLTLALVALAFLAGWFFGGRSGSTGSGEREVLYWVDPMNPAFRSPEPGTAPCGMPLEPVYAGGSGPAAGAVGSRTIFVPADRRQLVGIVIEIVEPGVVEGTLRLPGRVEADERRVHVVAPKTVGSVQTLGIATVGSVVGEGEFLVSVSSSATTNAQSALLQALSKLDSLQRSAPDEARIAQQRSRIQASRQTLLNYGLSAEQIASIERSRQPTASIEMRSPVAGYVLSRHAVLGQEFHAYAPLFVVADIERAFVLADVLNEEIDLLQSQPRAIIRVPGRPHRFEAVADPGPHQFDAALGGQRIRFEVDNPSLVLLPGMFVDVELPIRTAEVLSVPVGAVVDSGRSRRVYVDLGQGRFEPRRVETGWRLGGRVQILDGLQPAEAVVVSGNFLLDSESRMRSAGDWPATEPPRDPVCEMLVDEVVAREAGRVSELDGTEFLFCSDRCKERFDADPAAFRTEEPIDD